jgi:hypothetical protein
MARRRLVDAEHPAYDPGSCDADGRAQCRRCLAPLPSPRAEFCSPACQHEFLVRVSPAYARKAVFARDRGVCTHCRIDCGLLDRIVARLRARPDAADDEVIVDEAAEEAAAAERDATAVWLIARLGFGRRARPCSLWQADHRTPFSAGGADCGLGNYRTLCLVCHARQTRELHARKAAARRVAAGR